MRRIFTYLLIAIALALGVWLLKGHDQVTGMVKQYVENGEVIALKARYTAEQIMESHKKELLVDAQHSYQEPAGLKFHPYLLLEVKYVQADKNPREGMILWSLIDGEMLLSTDTWDKSHGFEDAINADASRNDLRLMQAIAKQKSGATFDQLQKELHIEKDTLNQWANSALSKHLIVQRGSELQLHFQDPKILVQPETKITDLLVKKPYDLNQRVSTKYSSNQIQKIAKAIFGEDFTIRNMTEVFLPVYSITVVNPDGSTFTSFWNALTGQKMAPRYGLKGW